MDTSITTVETLHDAVRRRYAQAATEPGHGGCCATGASGCGAVLYGATDRSELPVGAVLASLGCGNPVAVAELREGERVLDLGSGGGIDVLLAAGHVGPTGRAIGLDMTDEMLELAWRNAAGAGISNVEFLRGTIEQIPLPGGSIDVVISNCVINLAADKPAVFREIARVLRPGGRMHVADILAEDRLGQAERAERGDWSGCIAGAMSFREMTEGLASAGLTEISISPTHEVADGMVSAIIRARRPDQPESLVPARREQPMPRTVGGELPVAGTGCCGGACC
jgi:SAM-dependent methyltransferase